MEVRVIQEMMEQNVARLVEKMSMEFQSVPQFVIRNERSLILWL